MKLCKDIKIEDIKNFPKEIKDARVYVHEDNPILFVGNRKSMWIKELHNSRSKFVIYGRVIDGVYYPKDEYERVFTSRGNKRVLQEQDLWKQPEPESEPELKPSQPLKKAPKAKFDTKKVDSAPLLYETAKQIGVVKDLCNTFGAQEAKIILSLTFFNLIEGSLVARKYQRWSENRNLPFKGKLTDKQISEFFRVLGTNETKIDRFFEQRFNRYCKERFYSYDSTNFACNSELITHSTIGKGKHGEIRPQVGLAVIYGHDSHQPLSFRLIKGNTNDQQTMEELIERYQELRAVHPDWCCHITDRGYFSEGNLQLVKQANLKFLLAAKTSVGYIAQAIEENKSSIFSATNYIAGSEDDYGITIVHELPHKETEPAEQYKVYLHLYFSLTNKLHELKKFNQLLDRFEDMYRNAEQKIFNEPLTVSQKKKLAGFFNFDQDHKLLGRRNEVIDEYVSRLGFYANVTTWDIDANTAWKIYSGRDCIEKAFKFGKCDLEIDTVRVHRDETCEGKFFIYFIGLAILEELKRRLKIRPVKKLKNTEHVLPSLKDEGLTFRDLLSELKGTRQRTYSNGKVLYDDITKNTLAWFKKLDLEDAYKKHVRLYDELNEKTE